MSDLLHGIKVSKSALNVHTMLFTFCTHAALPMNHRAFASPPPSMDTLSSPMGTRFGAPRTPSFLLNNNNYLASVASSAPSASTFTTPGRECFLALPAFMLAP